jgi:TRAP-type C4-dicarboxylate transport system permease small subunit
MTVTEIRNALAIIRDALAIVIMLVFLWVGYNVVRAASDVSDRLNPPAAVQQDVTCAPFVTDC